VTKTKVEERPAGGGDSTQLKKSYNPAVVEKKRLGAGSKGKENQVGDEAIHSQKSWRKSRSKNR